MQTDPPPVPVPNRFLRACETDTPCEQLDSQGVIAYRPCHTSSQKPGTPGSVSEKSCRALPLQVLPHP